MLFFQGDMGVAEQGHLRPAGRRSFGQGVQIVLDTVHMPVGIEDDHAVKGGQAVQRFQRAEIAVPGDGIDPRLGGLGQGQFQIVEAVAQKNDGVGVFFGRQDAADRLGAAVAVAQDQ